jgi:hypothetical protein
VSKNFESLLDPLCHAFAHKCRWWNQWLKAENGRKVLDLAYTPGSAWSSFFLFGFLKEKVRRMALIDEENQNSRVQAIFDEISDLILTSVWMIWIKLFHWMMNNGDEYSSE